MILWVCGEIMMDVRLPGEKDNQMAVIEGITCSFRGIHSTEQKAIDACMNDNFFRVPIEIDAGAVVTKTNFPNIGCTKAIQID